MLVKYRGYGYLYSVKDGKHIDLDQRGFLYSGVFALLGADANNLTIMDELEIGAIQPIEHPNAPAIIPAEYRNKDFAFSFTNQLGYGNCQMTISKNPLVAKSPMVCNVLEFLDAIPEMIAHRVLGKNYISPDLLILIEAAEKFWANADPKEKDTHAKQPDVSDWLIEKGLSAISAQQGAAMIRPEWAVKGRRSTD